MMAATILKNRYRLASELGRGGMGVVYSAEDILLERPVAVKLLSAPTLGEGGRARLLQEARTVARLNHPNIVTIYDVAETNGDLFIVMELVDGHSLHAQPPRDFAGMLSIATQICTALDHAHRQGIVHRDLKPENVLVSSDGTAKLMDFGLAYSIANHSSVEGSLTGTVYYMAPEQALGKDFDGRADLYALGVMLFELSTGRLPFQGDDPLDVISLHIHAPVLAPRTINPGLPPALNELILQLLAKEPAGRPVSAQVVLRTLEILKTLSRMDVSKNPQEGGASYE